MEHNKKRRNSILKKTQINSEETTAEITSKIIRRISFSGKKSVKEFRPGEEEATIWGTSYEESAEVLQSNSTESGLVNVNEKRIMLRNRRVIVEPNSTTQRRSKKKVSVAENDKENVFIQQSQAEVSLNERALPPATAEPVTKTESPVKSELALIKIHLEDKNSQTMSEPLDRGNICSSTFDFINYSGLINRSITIEQSVDVTLNENELQLFKFRVPVSSTDVSPNLSLSRTRDGSSPNIFSQSILMSEKDLNILKLIRGKREKMDMTESHLTEMEARKIEEQRRHTPSSEQQKSMAESRKGDVMQVTHQATENHANQSMNVSHLVAPHSNSTQKKTVFEDVDMEEDTAKGKNRNTLLINQNMNISQTAEAKSLKRKTVTKVENMLERDERDSSSMVRRTISHPTVMDCSSMDINSPLRKKPMHNANNQMDITKATSLSSFKAEPIKRQTIHFESAVVEESLICVEDEMTGQSPFNASMEKSVAVTDVARQTIYFDHNQIHEDSICQSTRPVVAAKRDNNISMDLSTCRDGGTDPATNENANKEVFMIEDSFKITTANATASAKIRQTIYTPTDITEEAAAAKPRQSIYTSSDIVEDSPSPKKVQSSNVTHENAARSQYESIIAPADITIEDSPKAATDCEPSKSTVIGRQTIYSSTGIDEDVPAQAQPSKGGVKQRQSIYTPTDIVEDSPKAIVCKGYVPQRCNDAMDESVKEPAAVVRIPTKIPIKRRHTIYPSSDIIADSPKPIKQHVIHKPNAIQRHSVRIPSDIIGDSPLDEKSNVVHCQATHTSSERADEPANPIPKASFKQRQSEAAADHRDTVKPVKATMSKPAQRQSIYTPSDMIVDSPKAANKSSYAPEFSETLQSPLKASYNQPQTKTNRQSIYTCADMEENSPKVNKATEAKKSSSLQRKSIHFVTEMAEASPEKLESSHKTDRRQTTYAAADMIEDAPKGSSVSHHQALDDMVAEPPPTKHPAPKIVVKHLNLKQGISGPQAVLKVLKNQQAKTKLLIEANADDSSMEMSVHDESPKPSNKMNFCQLNEEMLRGRTKPFTEQRKGKSLFDDLEKQPMEEIKFDSFIDKIRPTGCVIQPARNSMKDYTMELSMKQSFSSKKKRDSDYTMNLSLEDTAVKSLSKQQCKEETENSIVPSVAEVARLPKNSCERRTIHFNEDLEEEHVNPNRNVTQKNRPTIHFNQNNDLEDSQVQPASTANVAHDDSTNNHAVNYKSLQSSYPQADDDTMDLCTIGLGNSMSQSKQMTAHGMDLYTMGYRPPQTSKSLLKDDDDTMDLSTVGYKKPLSESEQRTLHVNASETIAEFQGNQRDCIPSTITSRTMSKRQTINVHHEMDLDDTRAERVQSVSHSEFFPKNDRHSDPDLDVVSQLPQSSARRTVYLNQDLEVEGQQAAAPSKPHPHTYQAPQTYRSSKRATIHLNDDIELDAEEQAQEAKLFDETAQNTATNTRKEVVSKTKRHTIHFNQDLEVEEDPSDHLRYRNSPAPSKASIQKQQTRDLKASRRQTLHFNDDIEFEKKEQARQTFVSDETKRNTANNGHRTSPNELATKTKRHTIHFNQDLEMEEDSSEQHLRYRNSPAPSKASIQKQQITDLKASRRQTLHFNDDIEFEEKEQARQTFISDETKRNTANNGHRTSPNELATKTKRQTIHFNQDLEMEEDSSEQHLRYRNSPAPSKASIQKQQITDLKASRRQTLHFNDDIELDEDAQFDETKPNSADTSKSIRQTIHFHQNNELEKSVVQPQEELMRGLPKPRRLTIHDDVPLDESPQKCTLRKSSFSRTLNFNEIQTAHSKSRRETTTDVSVQKHLALKADDYPQSKGHDITSEIDRSLAEYLKTEEATLLFRSNSQDTSIDKEPTNLQTGHYNEQRSQSKLKIPHEPLNIFEESGMQPLQKGTGLATTFFDAAEQSIQGSDSLERSKIDMARETRLNVQAKNLKSLDDLDRTEMEETRNKSPKRFDYSVQRLSRLGHEIPNVFAAAECDDSMEMSVLSEEPVKLASPKKTLLRKTIHFTNENAVDESFFDENLSKPVAHKNLQTVFCDESKNPISEMDVTVGNSKSMTRSKAVQSMKEILMESNMLFTQSRLLQPCTFESKRSTIYFTGKDDSLDVTNESMECDIVDDECVTPTKNKLSKSRIPQLIDSAKKLQSLKKSMEFIQQELPHIGSHLQKAKHDDFPQKETVAKNLHQSFDSAGATHEPAMDQESFETVEIPRSATTPIVFRILQDSPNTETREPEQARLQLQESFDTVEIPRRATTFQKNDTLQLCSNATLNTSQKSLYKFEDEPITVSNVSTFFSQKPLPAATEPYSPNTTEALCNLDVNVIAVDDQLPKSSDSEDTAHHIDKFKKRYVELTCDSIRLSGLMDDIDKTRLSLVNTLDEEASEVVLPTNCSEQVPTEPPASPLKPVASVCRKCKHRFSLTQNDTTIGSFMLEPQPEYKIDFCALEELASKPKISDVAKVWRQRMRQSDSFNVSDESRSIALDDEDSLDKFIADLDKNRLGTAAQHRQRKTFKKETSFVHNVKKRLESQKSNWILNELLLTSNILRFSHTRIRTFAIFISFTPKDPRGIEVNFNEIKLVPNVLHTRQWTPFDSALHYQLLVELPFDLRKLCPTSENLFQLLQQVEEVTQNVLTTGKDMLHLVLTSPASLIRESSGSVYIRKYARTKTPQNDVRRTEFVIEVRNIKQLSYKSIVVPPLYEFDEKIQMLPVGQDFLRVFLADPIRYMKTC